MKAKIEHLVDIWVMNIQEKANVIITLMNIVELFFRLLPTFWSSLNESLFSHLKNIRLKWTNYSVYRSQYIYWVKWNKKEFFE